LIKGFKLVVLIFGFHGIVMITIPLFILSVISVFLGCKILVGAESAVHEIEALILLLIAAVLFVGSSLHEAVNRVRKELREEEPEGVSDEYQMIKILKEIEKNTKIDKL